VTVRIIGGRIFAPRVWSTLLTALLVALLVSLGRWQLHRAAEKRAMYAAFAAGSDRTVPIDAATAPVARYQHVVAAGHYDALHQFLIDNMPSAQGRAGYFVITPLQLAGGATLLVNRGWVPLGATRADMPNVTVDAAPRVIHGRADHLPIAGISMGVPAPLVPPYPIVAQFPTTAEIAKALGRTVLAPAAEVVLLDARESAGYARDWQPPGFPAARHLAYAVQWFALAVTLLIIYFFTNSSRREGA
jgi:surfeit locus 1 family protein